MPTACRRICIFYKTCNPKNDDLSDKSGSYWIIHKSFNNMFDTKMCRTSWVSLCFHYLFMNPRVYEILRQMFRGTYFLCCVYYISIMYYVCYHIFLVCIYIYMCQ